MTPKIEIFTKPQHRVIDGILRIFGKAEKAYDQETAVVFAAVMYGKACVDQVVVKEGNMVVVAGYNPNGIGD